MEQNVCTVLPVFYEHPCFYDGLKRSVKNYEKMIWNFKMCTHVGGLKANVKNSEKTTLDLKMWPLHRGSRKTEGASNNRQRNTIYCTLFPRHPCSPVVVRIGLVRRFQLTRFNHGCVVRCEYLQHHFYRLQSNVVISTERSSRLVS